jgi:hypothetical protein
MKRTHTLVLGLTLAAFAGAAAQRPQHPTTPATPTTHQPAAHPTESQPAAAQDKTTFQGIAKKLNTTPDALESGYQAALAANPNLTRGQFVAANVLAQNLGAKNTAITTDAILAGLKSGKSIGQTLQSLGLSAAEAQQAEQAAERQVREAEQPAK